MPGIQHPTRFNQKELDLFFREMKPGSVQGLVLTTKNIADTHAKLKARKLDISDIKKQPWGPEATFRDPDGNGWVLQQSR